MFSLFIENLDPDLQSFKIGTKLDPEPQIMNVHPQPWKFTEIFLWFLIVLIFRVVWL